MSWFMLDKESDQVNKKYISRRHKKADSTWNNLNTKKSSHCFYSKKDNFANTFIILSHRTLLHFLVNGRKDPFTMSIHGSFHHPSSLSLSSYPAKHDERENRRKSINILIMASERMAKEISSSIFRQSLIMYTHPHTHTTLTQTRCPAYPSCPSPQCLCRNLCTLCMFYDFHLVIRSFFDYFFILFELTEKMT